MTTPPEVRDSSSKLDRIAADVRRAEEGAGHSGPLPKADVAEMRRMRHDRVQSVTLWRLLVRYEIDASPEDEVRWSLLMRAAGRLGAKHTPSVFLGEALVKAGVSEARLSRLLRADGTTLLDQVAGLIDRLYACRDTIPGVDLRDFERLLATRPDTEVGMRVRQKIARAYFRNEPKED
jgi:CRISPR type I-E-associated protein CasB/Cse2